MATEIVWTHLIYLGRREAATAWRVFDSNGETVVFVVRNSDLKDVIMGLRLRGPLIGADSERHAELCRLLAAIGLPQIALTVGSDLDRPDDRDS